MFNSFVTPWTVACQAPLSMGFSRQEYWSGLPFPSPGDLPDLGIKLRSPLTSEPPGKTLHGLDSQVNDLHFQMYVDVDEIFQNKTFISKT